MKPKASSPVVCTEATLDETVGSLILTFGEIALRTIFKPYTAKMYWAS